MLYFSDAFLEQSFQLGNNFSLALEFDSKEEQEKVYQRLSEDGILKMELQETFGVCHQVS